MRRGRVCVCSPCSLHSFRAGRHRSAAAAAAAPSPIRHRPPARPQARTCSPQSGLFPQKHREAAAEPLDSDDRGDEDDDDDEEEQLGTKRKLSE